MVLKDFLVFWISSRWEDSGIIAESDRELVYDVIPKLKNVNQF